MPNSWICIDANLVFRLVANPTDLRVRLLWAGWRDQERIVAAPTLLYYELTNALHRAQKAGLLSTTTADDALRLALTMPIQVQGDTALHGAAMALARRFNLPAAYDAHYLALAEQLNAEFWTADERLVNSVRPALPWVHLLGE
jgi:predicted nucleic acid-binding protein